MQHIVKSKWVNKMAFDSQIDQHSFRMDSAQLDGEDSGPSPKKLLLASLAGCTGMDVASLLKKMRVPVAGFEIDIEGDLTEEHPKVYSEIRMVYRFYGTDLKKEKVEKSVDLSRERYCGVSAMIKKSCPIKYSIEYKESVAQPS